MFTLAVTLMGVQAHARKARVKGRSVVVASGLARQALEEAQSKGFEGLSYGETSRKQSVQALRQGMALSESFTVVQNVRTGPLDSLKSVLITVRWSNGAVTLEGYVAR